MKQIKDYRRLFLEGVPMLDVRAPVEYQRGAFPGTENLPLLDDPEREQVGITYKEQGNSAAVAIGEELVSGAVKAERIAAWQDFANRHPDGCLYCFRGGQRSEIAQRWLAESGCPYPRVKGGYKAMRRFLIDNIERLAKQFHLLLLGGRTGVGKTELLAQVEASVDLEGLANHRGSGFGRRVDPQPGQIDFENALAIAMLRQEAAGHNVLVLEDESRCIGARNIPEPLWEMFAGAPVVLLEDDLESRIHRTRQEYVDDECRAFLERYPEDGFQRFADHLRDCLKRISRRLGGQRYDELSAVMDEALEIQQQQGLTGRHEAWIERLLVDYYDPMYDFQIKNKGDRVRFVGGPDEVIRYLASHS